MKRTQLKDALRNIRKQSLLFLSIVAITMLGAATYLSIYFSILGIGKNTGDRYSELNFRDFEVISSKLLSPADLDALRGVNGVAAVEPVWQTGGKAGAGELNEEVTVISITEETNLPMLLEGRLPEEPAECAVEKLLMDQFGWKIGETIEVRGDDGGMPEYLLRGTFRITGVANHPDHANTAAPETLYLMVPREAFDLAALDNCSVKAEILLEKDAELSLFSNEYQNLAEGMKKTLEALAREREPVRDREVYARSSGELEENRAKLRDAGQELEDAGQKLTEGETALTDAEKELEEKKGQLADAGKKLEDASQALQEGEKKLANAKEQLISSQAALLRAGDQLNYAKLVLADAKRIMNTVYSTAESLILEATSYLPEDQSSLEGAQGLLEDLPVSSVSKDYTPEDAAYLRDRVHGVMNLKYRIAYGETDLKNAEMYYHQGIEQYQKGFTEYEIGLREYAEKRQEYTQGKKDYEEAVEKADSAEKELQEKRKELAEKKEEYQKASKEYQDGQKALAEAEDALNALQPARWTLLRVMDNTSFIWQNGVITQTRQIQAVFSTFFLIISVLVIYSSVQKLVLEQRPLIGMGKAQGLYNQEILLKYLVFGLLGTTAGILLGTAAAYFILEPLVLQSANLFVVFDISRPVFHAGSVLLMAAALEIITFLSVYAGCMSLLRSSATSLMQTQVPKYGRKTARPHSGHLPLMIRMIPRGMRANPGRVLVTIVSVAGCCSLVVMGFTTKNRIDGVLTHQYPGISDYDLEVSFDGSAGAKSGLEEVLRSLGTEYVLVGSESVLCEENDRTAATLVTGDLEAISGFYHLLDYQTGEPLSLDQEGVYIYRGFSETFHLLPGDPLAISRGFDAPVQLRAGGIYDNYLGWNFFLRDADYEAAFGKASVKNLFFVRLGAADEAQLRERLAKVPGFEKITAADSSREIFASVSSTMNMLVVLMIVLAGILAAFIIVSLTKCYLLQKNNEAMVMRINGFTFREVILYLMAEIIVDTVLGILLGFVVGEALSVYMLGQMESVIYRTIRGIDLPAMLLGAGITALFSLAINAVCLRPLKKMRLSELT